MYSKYVEEIPAVVSKTYNVETPSSETTIDSGTKSFSCTKNNAGPKADNCGAPYFFLKILHRLKRHTVFCL